MSASFEGQTAIVTGGGQGIGQTYCEMFASEGANVVVADVNFENARNVASNIADRGGSALAIAVDIADEASVRELACRAEDRFGPLTVLVNNAALFTTLKREPFSEISLENWTRVIDVNLTGVFLCSKYIAPAMCKQGYGRIVNISSLVALNGSPDYLHYVASKSALLGMTRSMARELGPDGITVNAVLPGPVRTDIERDWFKSDTDFNRAIAAQSIKRVATPADIAAAVRFLASAEAGFITGQCLTVDGGRTMG